MLICVVCDVLGKENNGTTIAAMNLIRALQARGHTVRVVCPDQDRMGKEGYYITHRINLGPLNNYLKKNGVVIARTEKQVLQQALEGVDHVHIMTPFALSIAALRMAKEKGISVTAGFHCQAENFTSHLFLKDSKLANRMTYRQFYRSFYRYVDAVHYPSQFIRETFERYAGKTNGYVISNGVSSDFAPCEATRPAEYAGKYIVQFTGRFSPEKSHKVLIDAVACCRHADKIQLIFAGDGPLREKLEKYAKKLKNPPVFDFFTRQEMVRLLNCADLYVHPAEIEIEAIACLEAISCGLVPVISNSPRSATRFFALDDKNLFACNDSQDLAKKIDYWLDHPADKAARSREYLGYTKQYDREACMDRMEQMILATHEQVRKRAV